MRAERAALLARQELRGGELTAALAEQADGWFAALADALPQRWALAATGGYGRGGLCPGSDIDVMLLHPPRTSDAEAREVAEAIWYPLWDAGFKLSPAVQSLKSALALADDDLQTATTLLGIRRLAGDQRLVAAVGQKALERWRKRSDRWLRRLLEASTQRWAAVGEVASLLEPNLKEGRGGIRDRDVLGWALLAGGDDVEAALEGPLDELDACAATLTAARAQLHRSTGRSSDVLVLQEQDDVAAALGMADADDFMRDVAAAARTIDWASGRFWRRVDRVVNPPRWPGHRSRSLDEPAAGVVVIGDELHLTGAADLEHPACAFEVAAVAAHHAISLSREALVALAEAEPVDESPWSLRTRKAFVGLLGTGEALIETVETLERYGLFSRALPEWVNVRSLPQRNAFHTYNVDRHLLRTVANAAKAVRSVARPDLLLVGALLHDIGKGYDRDHTEVGIELAAVVMARIGFDDADTATVVALVAHHLLLAETATRRDLADPRTAANVAEALGSVERLELLRALTEADSLATGPAAWSTWKQMVVERLVGKARQLLEGSPVAPAAAADERFADMLRTARSSRRVAVELDDLGGGVVGLQIAAKDRKGLFAEVSGVLVLHRLDVLSADVFASADGLAVDQFHVMTRGGDIPSVDQLARDLDEALAGRLDVAGRIESRLARSRSSRRAVAAAPPRTEVMVSNDASDTATMIDVRLPDGPALLYRLASSLARDGLDIRSAKVATLGHEVVDVFYVQLPGRRGEPGRKLDDAQSERVAAALQELVANG